jgi:putative transcriptional regulator
MGRTARAPAHHPPAEILMDYVNGALGDGETLMVETHLALCGTCLRVVRSVLQIGGALLEALRPADLPVDLFNRTLAAIGRGTRRWPDRPDRPLEFSKNLIGVDWPAPLRARIAGDVHAEWRRLPAGIRALPIACEEPGTRVWVMKAPGGRGLFRHRHDRDEWTLVLEGGYSDERGSYVAGDFVIGEVGYEHHVVADRGEGCTCILLTRARPRYTTWAGRLAQRLFRI